MRPRVSVFIAASLDGFIARPDGSLDWLETANASVPPGEDCGYQAFMDTVDGLVIGRHTYETVLGFGCWPYAGKRVIALSSQPLTAPAVADSLIEGSSENPPELLTRLQAEGLRHIYVDGGVTIRSFLCAGLVDRLTITTIPILLGQGRPLFGERKGDLSLRLESSRAYPFGFVQSTYRVGPA